MDTVEGLRITVFRIKDYRERERVQWISTVEGPRITVHPNKGLPCVRKKCLDPGREMPEVVVVEE